MLRCANVGGGGGEGGGGGVGVGGAGGWEMGETGTEMRSSRRGGEDAGCGGAERGGRE